MDDLLREAWDMIEQAEVDLLRTDHYQGEKESLRRWLEIVYSRSDAELRIWGAQLKCLNEGLVGDPPEGTA